MRNKNEYEGLAIYQKEEGRISRNKRKAEEYVLPSLSRVSSLALVSADCSSDVFESKRYFYSN